MSSRRYAVNEIFASLQGEGVRAGTANVFVRFSGCNLTCKRETHGFDCDTEFTSGRAMTALEIVDAVKEIGGGIKAIVLTGGEPTLQLDQDLITALSEAGYYLAIETNGTEPVPEGIDWICVSPKVAEHALRQTTADEVKYVRHVGQGIPKPTITADHYLLSPAATTEGIDPASLAWCIKLVKENSPKWRLSVQQHKLWGVR